MDKATKAVKCWWCGKPSKLGMHDLCWLALKRMALS